MNNETEQMFLLNDTANQPSGSNQKQSEIPGITPVNLDDVVDFSNVCRTCTTITECVTPIFSGDGLLNNLADKIHKHLPITVSESDPLPQVLCFHCASTLLAWHELVQCCVQADEALRAKIAADTKAQNGLKKTHEEKSTSQKSSVLAEDAQSKFKDITEYVAQNIVLPPYPELTIKCQFCHAEQTEAAMKEHLITVHPELVFYCEECNEYVDRKLFIQHMSLHALEYNQEKFKKAKKAKKKKESDVNQNINMDGSAVPPAEMTPVTEKAPDTGKNNEVDEFSDHSDTESGFGPLPESVFEAIEDSQDSQPAEETSQTEIDRPNEPDKSNTPVEELNTKKLRERARICPICSKVYTASSSYFYHMKYTHKRVRDHECSVCGKKFATKAGLTSHSTTHTGECRFECKECKKLYSSKASLYIHEQTHNGIKNWSCAQCRRSFRWKTHLLRHMKRHSAEKAHVCSTCGRGFSIRCDLLRHARTHAAGNFSCDKCDVKFAQLRYLKVHMEKKHGKNRQQN